jgi:hypothetical protein
MTKIKTNQNANDGQATDNEQSVNDTVAHDEQVLLDQIASLVEEAKKISGEIDETNKEAEKEIDEIGTRVDRTVKEIDGICSDLDKADKTAGDALDKLALEQAEDLASED